MAVPITIDTVAGNYVILDLGGGQYALYAHLQPGSLRVKVGDRVRRAQVLGTVESVDDELGGKAWTPKPGQAAEPRRMEIPLENTMVRFDSLGAR